MSENKQLWKYVHQLERISGLEKLRPEDWLAVHKLTQVKKTRDAQERPMPSITDAPRHVDQILRSCPADVVSSLSEGLARFGFVELPASTKTKERKGVCGQVSLAIEERAPDLESLEDRLVVAVKKQPVSGTGYKSVWIETTIMRSCSHPNIVQFLGHFYVSPPAAHELDAAKKTEKMLSFIIMEYASAGDLEKELQRFLPSKSMPETHARFYSYHVIQGLHYLHSRTIEYGDLHAGNVLLRYNSDFSKTPVLCDFGLSRIIPESEMTADNTPFARDVRQVVDLIRLLVTGCDRENVPLPATVSPSAKKLLTESPPPTVGQLVLDDWFSGPSEPFIDAPVEVREAAVQPRKKSENKLLRRFSRQLQRIADSGKLQEDDFRVISKLAEHKPGHQREEHALPAATQAPRQVTDILTSCPADVVPSLSEGLARFGFLELPTSAKTNERKGVCGQVSLAIRRKQADDEAVEDRLVVAVKKQPVSGTGYKSVWIETTIMRSCSHPNIVQFLGHFYVSPPAVHELDAVKKTEKMHSFIIMEYASAGDLEKELQRFMPSKSMPEPHARFYSYHVIQGLHYLHSRTIEYGDLHAGNVLLRYNSDFSKTPVLCDFGLSRIIPESEMTADNTPFARDVRQVVDLIRLLLTGCDRENVPLPATVSPSAKKLLTESAPPTVGQLVLHEWFSGPSEPFIETPGDMSGGSSPSGEQQSFLQRLAHRVRRKQKRAYTAPHFKEDASDGSSSSGASASQESDPVTASSSGLTMGSNEVSRKSDSDQEIATSGPSSSKGTGSQESVGEKIMFSLPGMSQVVKSRVPSSLPDPDEPKREDPSH